MGIESERELEFHSPLGPDTLMVRHFVGSEHLGTPFEYSVTLFSQNHDIESEALLGNSCTVEVKLDRDKPRYFNGIACEFSHVGISEGYAVYRLTMRPWFWLLSRNAECRIFQNKTTLEIARQIFDDNGFPDRSDHLFNALTPREYCVQFNESDYAFLSRLFEYEGIYYYFKHEKDKHTLVLADSISAHDPAPGYEQIAYANYLKERKTGLGTFSEWVATKQIRAGGVKLNDFNFKKSRANISAERTSPKEHEHADAKIYTYPGQYQEPAPGTDNAVVRLEEAQLQYDLARGATDCRGLFTGALFTLTDHPRKDQNKKYLVVSARYEIDSGQYRSGGSGATRMRSEVHVLDSAVQYRSPRVTAIPFVPGAQTARVVGPKGQEVWTDNFGRVKVQFAWDMEGKYDENSSCFIRVSQTWAGKDWGAWHIPRIGQEVLVGFLDGNLDKPIVIGRVHNDYNEGAWKLPDQASRSGFKTHSFEGGKDDFNELRFEDAKQQEEIFVRAQRNLMTRVRKDRHTFVGNDQSHTVKKNVSVVLQEGNYGNTTLKGSISHIAPENKFEVSAKEIVCTADNSITLSVANSSITIDKKGITLAVGGTTELKLTSPKLSAISPMIDFNPLGGMAGQPAKPTRPTPKKNSEKFEDDSDGAGKVEGANDDKVWSERK